MCNFIFPLRSILIITCNYITHSQNPLTSSSFNDCPLIFPLLLFMTISVKNLVDLYGKDELIYLGPDEQVRKKRNMLTMCMNMTRMG